MMAIEPLGPMSIALAKAREIVSSTAEFISRCGAADADAAAEFVFIDDRPAGALAEGQEPLTLWATVFEFTGDTEYELERLRAERGSTMVSFFRQRPAELAGNRVDAVMDFRNFVGVVIQQILALSKTPIDGGAAFFLGVRKVRQVVPASWCEPRDSEDDDFTPFLMATFVLEWV